MFSKTKTALFALAAVAAIGIASVATSSSADARGFAGGGGGFSRGGGAHIGHIGGQGGGARIGSVGKLGGTGWRVVPRNPGFKVGQGQPCRYSANCGIDRHPPRPHWCRWTGRCHIHVRWPRPFIYGVGAVATSYAVAPTVATAAPAPSCTCLKKEYTQDGLVVFQDACTKEVASAPIGNTQVQLQLPAPAQQQAPVQQ